MATGYSRSPKLLKGAIIQFSAPMIIPIPNVIIFQYNPESLSRTLHPYAPPDSKAAGSDKAVQQTNEQSQPFDPTETFTLSLQLDASDALEVPELHPAALLTGVADRLAALEMLLYPTDDSAFGFSISVNVSLNGAGGGGVANAAEKVPAKKAPPVLFVWGPGRIVPVKVTSFSVDEQLNNPLLYPLRAKVSLGLQVRTPEGFGQAPDTIEKLLIGCYKFTHTQKKILALANVANSVESILGMLPF